MFITSDRHALHTRHISGTQKWMNDSGMFFAITVIQAYLAQTT